MQTKECRNKSKKNHRLFLTAIFVVLFVLMMSSAVSAQTIMGDVNGDGRVDVRDVVLIQKHVLGKISLTAQQRDVADVNGDGLIDARDVALVMQRSIGRISTFPLQVTKVDEVFKSVAYGTPQAAIGLPSTVSATISNGAKRDISVQWDTTSTPAYNPFVQGSYVFYGNLVTLPSGITNPSAIKAKATVNISYMPGPQPGPYPPYSYHYLTMTANPSGAGVVSSSGYHIAGENVPISAVSNPGYAFNNWTRSPAVGIFGNASSPTTTYTMPAQAVTVTANFITGTIDNASAADFVYDATNTSWSFRVVGADLLSGQQITIDLSDATAGNLAYSTTNAHYTVTNFTVDASGAGSDDEILLTATSTITAGTTVTIGVSGMTAAGTAASGLEITFIREDNNQNDTATFNIIAPAGKVWNMDQNTLYDEIQAAIDDADPGDTLFVGSGTFNETININKANLHLKSTNGAASTIIRGGGGAAEADAVVYFSANGVTLEGFTIDRNNAIADSRAVGPGNSVSSTIKDNIIISAFRGIQGDWYGTPTNLTIVGNAFNTNYGVAGTEGMDWLLIMGNIFNTPDEAIGLGVGVVIVDDELDPIDPSDDVEWLEDNNTFNDDGGVVDYR